MRFAEFFSGGGMARAGLGEGWQCVFANDVDPVKCRTYRENWGNEHLLQMDVAKVEPNRLLQPVDLYWASSPCQDFSLAGTGAGLCGERSGTFFPWINLVRSAVKRGYGARVIVFENVTGLISRRDGADFEQVVLAFNSLGYRVGAVEIDAADFLPQSRKRIFVVAVRKGVRIPKGLSSNQPKHPFHSKTIQKFVQKKQHLGGQWIWWNLPKTKSRMTELIDLVDHSYDHRWYSDAKVEHLLSIMTDSNLQKVQKALDSGTTQVGTVYKRGRPDSAGVIKQRAEVRFDGTAGCLRTPAGGSSRQTLLFVDKTSIRARLLSPREAMRLMGISEKFVIPNSYNDAYKLAGDGVVVPVVSFLEKNLLGPLMQEEVSMQSA